MIIKGIGFFLNDKILVSGSPDNKCEYLVLKRN